MTLPVLSAGKAPVNDVHPYQASNRLVTDDVFIPTGNDARLVQPRHAPYRLTAPCPTGSVIVGNDVIEEQSRQANA